MAVMNLSVVVFVFKQDGCELGVGRKELKQRDPKTTPFLESFLS